MVKYTSGNTTEFDTIQVLQSPEGICAMAKCAYMVDANDNLVGQDSIGVLPLAQEGIMAEDIIDAQDFQFYVGDFVLYEQWFEIMIGNTFLIEIEDFEQIMQAVLTE